MGKSTISTIFNRYVSLPEDNHLVIKHDNRTLFYLSFSEGHRTTLPGLVRGIPDTRHAMFDTGRY